MLKIIFIFALCGLTRARTSNDLKVRIEDGRVIGRYLTSESGKTIRAFMKIPYAEAPVGNLRFRAPVKVKPWQGILMAQNEPPMCTQINPSSRSKTAEGQEDCLYVNVYAPEVYFYKFEYCK
jgi:carboxylesterase type B